jgi:hypothetical protein
MSPRLLGLGDKQRKKSWREIGVAKTTVKFEKLVVSY